MELLSKRSELDTYRYLRIGMVLMVVLLGAAVVNQIFRTEPDCWLGSISAYYYTSARAVFVACLCAMGSCLIIYKGDKPFEDFVLNVSGFLAFVVALVPTPLKDLVINPATKSPTTDEPVCKRSNVPTGTQLVDAISNNVFALLVTATATLVVVWVFRLASRTGEARRYAHALTGSGAVLLLTVALVVAWALHLSSPDLVRQKAHLVSAVGMFGGIVLVVLLNARQASGVFKTLYGMTFALMCAAIVVFGFMAVRDITTHAVFWLEAALIALFGWFWLIQTKELWDRPTRSAETASGDTTLSPAIDHR